MRIVSSVVCVFIISIIITVIFYLNVEEKLIECKLLKRHCISKPKRTFFSMGKCQLNGLMLWWEISNTFSTTGILTESMLSQEGSIVRSIHPEVKLKDHVKP